MSTWPSHRVRGGRHSAETSQPDGLPSGAHPRIPAIRRSIVEPPPASRGVLASQVPPTAENPACIHGQRTRNLVRVRRAGFGRVRPHAKCDCDSWTVRRARSAAGAAGAGVGSPHRALYARRAAYLALCVGGAAHAGVGGSAVAFLAGWGACARDRRRNRGCGGDGAGARLGDTRRGRGRLRKPAPASTHRRFRPPRRRPSARRAQP